MINTAIIYSRTNSKRLKNKALLNVYKKKSLIEKVVENTLKIKSIKKVILATTKSKEDKIFEKILKKHEIDFFYGSTNNLIQRTVECSKKYNFDYFLRVCGDRPIFSFSHIESIISNINRNKSFKYDLISNNKKNKLVDQGLTIEIISSRSLEKIKFKKNLTKYNLENITSYYYQNEKKFKINHIKSPKNWFLNNKYTIDNNEDLKKIRLIISKVGYNNFDIGEANRIIRKFNL